VSGDGVDDFVTPENVAEYHGVGFSYVIDAIDSVRPKAALIAYCRRATRCRW
jgi:tRNA A37 threonylcarbamoyladenosine dehydratase